MSLGGFAVGLQFIEAALAHFHRPLRILQQRTPHRNQIEFALLQAREQFIKTAGGHRHAVILATEGGVVGLMFEPLLSLCSLL